MSMRFARVVATVGLADLQSFQCDLCGVVLTGEAIVEAAAMISASSPASADRAKDTQASHPVRTKELVERMATLRSRWLASVNDAVAGRAPRTRSASHFTKNQDYAAGAVKAATDSDNLSTPKSR